VIKTKLGFFEELQENNNFPNHEYMLS